MAQYTPKQLKSIQMEMDNHQSIVQLSSYPSIRFRRKIDGVYYDKDINWLESAYEQQRKDDSIQKAQEKRDQDRQSKIRSYGSIK